MLFVKSELSHLSLVLDRTDFVVYLMCVLIFYM